MKKSDVSSFHLNRMGSGLKQQYLTDTGIYDPLNGLYASRFTIAPNPKLELSPGEEHSVQFYETDEFLVGAVTMFIEPADVAIFIATPEHRAMIEIEIARSGQKKNRAKKTYIFFDAQTLLDEIMLDDMPNRRLFLERVGGQIKSFIRQGNKVKIYGEMVALLFREGNTQAALYLEELWNEFQVANRFSHFCSYSLTDMAGKNNTRSFSEICTKHKAVYPAESYAGLESADLRLREIAYLQQKARTLEEEVQKQRDLEIQKDEFLGIVSHELKTPLTSMKLFIDSLFVLLEPQKERKPVYLVRKIHDQANRLRELVNDLLDVSSIDAGKLKFQIEQFNLGDLIEDSIEGMQSAILKQRIFFTQRGNAHVRADRYRIYQVLVNILTNAMKYSAEDTKILVTLKKKGTKAIVSIEDFGIGIKRDQQGKIFERLYQVSDFEDKTFLGLGLGLYISKEIIERHNGRIWVKSQRGKGSTFSFSLPIASNGSYTT